MINNAKVSLSSVKAFTRSVSDIRDFWAGFDKGLACLDSFIQYLVGQVSLLEDSANKMRVSQAELSSKRQKLHKEISIKATKLTKLNRRKEILERIPNEVSAALLAEVEFEIITLENQLLILQQKLNLAASIDARLSSCIDTVSNVISSMYHKRKTTSLLRDELETIKNKSNNYSSIAFEKLKKIETIIKNYIRIRMTYDSVGTVIHEKSSTTDEGKASFEKHFIKKPVLNESLINKPAKEKDSSIVMNGFSLEEIAQHSIHFDADGHICLYDNKTFGGKYNTYENRLSNTSANNSIWGRYIGERGESKFIPSERTVDGVVVKDILSKYGIDGIEYRNAEPDFEVCSEAVVKIKKMSENRDNYLDSSGIPVLGNFSQADIACAEMWNVQKKDGKTDWDGRKVFDYRRSKGLTWHEKCDTETMVLVKTEINAYFRHSGGCSECRSRDFKQSGGGFDE